VTSEEEEATEKLWRTESFLKPMISSCPKHTTLFLETYSSLFEMKSWHNTEPR